MVLNLTTHWKERGLPKTGTRWGARLAPTERVKGRLSASLSLSLKFIGGSLAPHPRFPSLVIPFLPMRCKIKNHLIMSPLLRARICRTLRLRCSRRWLVSRHLRGTFRLQLVSHTGAATRALADGNGADSGASRLERLRAENGWRSAFAKLGWMTFRIDDVGNVFGMHSGYGGVMSL